MLSIYFRLSSEVGDLNSLLLGMSMEDQALLSQLNANLALVDAILEVINDQLRDIVGKSTLI